jgi:uncharacterized membrane protein
MTKARLEAFSDGVIAIIITIMVLEMKPPHEAHLKDLVPMLPIFSAYVLSFLMVAIYWVNHHHLMHTVEHVTSGLLWANVHLLFWLSLVPFVTAWHGENPFQRDVMIMYAIVLLSCGIAYYILLKQISSTQRHTPELAAAVAQQTRKGMWSLVLYLVSVLAAFWEPRVTGALFLIVALSWLVPDRNIERVVQKME